MRELRCRHGRPGDSSGEAEHAQAREVTGEADKMRTLR